VGISQDYPLKTRTSKQTIGKIPGYKIIPSHPLKYPRSKQGLSRLGRMVSPAWRQFGMSTTYITKFKRCHPRL
jgi:hypothetical protein